MWDFFIPCKAENKLCYLRQQNWFNIHLHEMFRQDKTVAYTFKRPPRSKKVWVPHLANNANKAPMMTNCKESSLFAGTNWKGQEKDWGVCDGRLEPFHKVFKHHATELKITLEAVRNYQRFTADCHHQNQTCTYICVQTHTHIYIFYFPPKKISTVLWKKACKRTDTEYRNATTKVVAIF